MSSMKSDSYAPYLAQISANSTKRNELDAHYRMQMILQEAQRRNLISEEQAAQKKNWLGSVAKLGGLGAMLGSVIPGVGPAIGAAVGAGAGALIGGARAIGEYHNEGQSGFNVFNPKNLSMSPEDMAATGQMAFAASQIGAMNTAKAPGFGAVTTPQQLLPGNQASPSPYMQGSLNFPGASAMGDYGNGQQSMNLMSSAPRNINLPQQQAFAAYDKPLTGSPVINPDEQLSNAESYDSPEERLRRRLQQFAAT